MAEAAASEGEAHASSNTAEAGWRFDWKDISRRNLELLRSSRWHDCQFAVGRAGAQRTFRAHRLVLSSASEVFEAMLFGPLQEHQSVTVPDMEPDAFQAMLVYVYSGKLTVRVDDAEKERIRAGLVSCGGDGGRPRTSQAEDRAVLTRAVQLCDLYRAAHKYMIVPLKQDCVAELAWMSHRSVVPVLELATEYEEYALQEQAWALLSTHWVAVVRSPVREHLVHMSAGMVGALLSLAVSEPRMDDTFALFGRWLQAECDRRGVRTSERNMTGVLGDLLRRAIGERVMATIPPEQLDSDSDSVPESATDSSESL